MLNEEQRQKNWKANRLRDREKALAKGEEVEAIDLVKWKDTGSEGMIIGVKRNW